MKDLSEIRVEIDEVDAAILELYEKRLGLTDEVAAYKISVGKPVYDKSREIAKLEKLSSMASSEFSGEAIRALFEQIMTVSRINQYKIMDKHNLLADLGFKECEFIDVAGKTVVYQGVEGAYSQLAMKQFFGDKSYKNYNVESWRNAVEDVVNGKADYAVLPIENSSAGYISENFDLVNDYPVYIVGEQIVAVDHCLLGVKGAKLSDIKTVYSHPQALLQSDGYLRNKHNDWTAIAVSNTALAAKNVRDDADITCAAIGSKLNADIYDLEILEEGIQDNKLNRTRFMIIAKDPVYRKDSKKISVCFEIPNEKGGLYRILSHFIYNNLDLSKIESRPIQDKTWEYRFFVDVTGNINDVSVMNAILGVKSEATYLKILGNY